MNQILSSTTYWPNREQWLQRDSIPPRKRLLEVITHGQIPQQLLHQFACDCAFRATERNPHLTQTLRETLSYFLEQKQELFTSSQNSSIREKTMMQLHQQTKQLAKETLLATTSSAIQTVSWALFPNPMTAARYASKNVLVESEREWHCTHLTKLLEELQQKRHSFCTILQQRCWNLSQRLAFWQQEYEKQLF